MERKFRYEQKNKKFFAYFLVFMLCFQMLAPIFTWALETEISGMGGAPGSSAEVATMAAISLSYVKEDGSVTAITTEDVAEVLSHRTTKLRVKYDFTVTQDTTSTDNYFELSYPSGLDIGYLADTVHEDKSTSIVDGVEVPNKSFTYIFDAAARKIKVTFKEGVEATTPCFIEVDFWFDLTAGGQTNPVSYVFPIRESLEKRANFYFKPEASGNAVSKQGILYRSGTPTDKNPNEIFWRGEINRNLDVIAANALTVIENTFRSETLEYKADSIRVFPLEVDPLTGATSPSGGELTPVVDYTVDASEAGKLKIALKDSALQTLNGEKYLTRAYGVSYITAIKPSSQTLLEKGKEMIDFLEKATIAFQGAAAEAEVGFGRYPILQKDVKGSTGVIVTFSNSDKIAYLNAAYLTWTVWINQSGNELKNVVLTDRLIGMVDGLSAPTNIQLESYTIAADGSRASDGPATSIAFSATAAPNEWTYNLGDIPANRAYKLTYDTPVTYNMPSDIKEAAKAQSKDYDNIAQLEYLGGSATLTRDGNVYFGSLLEKASVFDPAYDNTDDQPRIIWHIDINKAQQPMDSGFEIVDILPEHLRYDWRGKTDLKESYEIYEIPSKYTLTGTKNLKTNTLAAEGYKIPTASLPIELEAAMPVNGQNRQELTFKVKQNTSKAYRIVFYTTYDKSKSYSDKKNEVQLKRNSIEKAKAEAEIAAFESTLLKPATTLEVKQELAGQDYFSRYYLDYDKKEMYWTIWVLPRKNPMEKLLIEDKFQNQGMTLIPESFAVYKKYLPLGYTRDGIYNDTTIPGSAATIEKYPASAYTLTPNGTNGFTVQFHETLTELTYITYRTKLDLLSHIHANPSTELAKASYLEYTNRFSRVEWEESGVKKTMTPAELDNRSEREAIYRVIPQNHPEDRNFGVNIATTNTAKSGRFYQQNLAERQLEWVVDINYLGYSLSNVEIADAISEGQEFLPETLKLYTYTRNGMTGAIENEQAVNIPYTLTVAEDKKSFVLKLNNAIDRPYAVKYRTQMVGISQERYKNAAVVTSNEAPSMTVDAVVQFPNYNKFISKEGRHIDRTWEIEWTADINSSLSEVKNAVIKDALSAHQEYDKDSFRLTRYAVNGTETPVNPAEYSLNIVLLDAQTGRQGFELKFSNPIAERYKLTYKTLITTAIQAGAQLQLSNQIWLEGDAIGRKQNENISGVKVLVLSTRAGSGKPQPKSGTLRIVKRDGETIPNRALEDVEFVLVQRFEPMSGNSTVQESTIALPKTNAQGVIEIKGLPFGKYVVRELQSLAGYQLAQEQSFEVTKTSLVHELHFVNYQKRSIQVLKTAEEGSNALEGAVFKLQKQESDGSFSEVGSPQTTAADGRARFDNLDFGKYRLIEAVPPRGYQLNELPIFIEIKVGSAMVHEINVKNKKETPAQPYTPPTAEPEKSQTVTPTPVQPENPTSETPGNPTVPTTPSETTPSLPQNDIPTPPASTPIEGELEIPDNHIPQVGIDPKNGTVELTGKKWKYTPNEGFYGEDSFTVNVTTPEGEEYDEIIEIDIPIPEGVANLPKTSGLPAMVYFVSGSVFLIASRLIRKRK